VGLRHNGNDPVALTQTRCPRARVQGTDQDFVALVVPGGVRSEALCNVVRGCTSNASGPVSAIETSGGLKCKAVVVSPRRLPRRSAPDRANEIY
jgi:hypothetical protein